MKKILIILGVFIVFVVVGGVLLVNKLNADVEHILDEEIQDLRFTDYDTGVYKGEYNEALAVNAVVEVTIIEGVVTKIDIVNHSNGKGEPAEVIVDDIINVQSLLVDDISGATYSSRVLKLAVQNALTEEENE